jgi:predicted type IV restriction endonuclease
MRMREPPALSGQSGESGPRKGVETTEEELEFFGVIQEICGKHGVPVEEILCRDTVNYFNVSHRRPTKWFIRFFGDTRRKCITTLVPVDDAIPLAQGFELEEAPATFGASRVHIESVPQMWALKDPL